MNKLNATIIALALIASVFLFGAAAQAQLRPWDVTFTLRYGQDSYDYRLSDNIRGIEAQSGNRAFYSGSSGKLALYRRLSRMQLDDCAVYDYILPGFSRVVRHFSYVQRARQDATVAFDAQGFHYSVGQDGVAVNSRALFERAITSQGRHFVADLPLSIDPAVTVERLKRFTVPKSTFSTDYSNSSANRKHNVELAVAALNGTTVGAGEKFSFNAVVGERSEARGYKVSRVISDGNYADGVGGGVCQVSTTLYNALLLAGFIPNAAPHSLVSGYVMVGFDAMVSYGAADMSFVNDGAHPIYISASADGAKITFAVYGEPDTYTIRRHSEQQRDPFRTVEIVDAQRYPELVYADQTKVVVGGSDGVTSRSYLYYYLGDRLVDKRLIRSNVYKRVDRVIARGGKTRTDPPSESAR